MGSTDAPRALTVVATAAAIALTSWLASSQEQDAREREGTQALIAMPVGTHDTAVIDRNEEAEWSASDWGRVISQDALDAFLVEANGEGAQAATIARSGQEVWVQRADAADQAGENARVDLGEAAGVDGEWDWSAVVAEGGAPGAGEVTLPATTAQELGLRLGDDITVGYEATNVEAAIGPRTISALTYDVPVGQAVSNAAVVFLSPNDPGLAQIREDATMDTSGEQIAPLTTDVVWQNATTATNETFYEERTTSFESDAALRALWIGALAGVGALALVTIAAFAARPKTPQAASAEDIPGWWARRTWGDIGAMGALAGAAIGIGATQLTYISANRDLVEPLPIGFPVAPLMPLALLALAALISFLSLTQVQRIMKAKQGHSGRTHPSPHAGDGSATPVTTASARLD
ncbi:hypothetical protein [Demequina flava]|uniref:hypothetical protein n=1 Tax=Demequina flava TaxID=1095025 RepID=UPI00078364CD|nr:hypothetical protein [Demequina flava]